MHHAITKHRGVEGQRAQKQEERVVPRTRNGEACQRQQHGNDPDEAAVLGVGNTVSDEQMIAVRRVAEEVRAQQQAEFGGLKRALALELEASGAHRPATARGVCDQLQRRQRLGRAQQSAQHQAGHERAGMPRAMVHGLPQGAQGGVKRRGHPHVGGDLKVPGQSDSPTIARIAPPALRAKINATPGSPWSQVAVLTSIGSSSQPVMNPPQAKAMPPKAAAARSGRCRSIGSRPAAMKCRAASSPIPQRTSTSASSRWVGRRLRTDRWRRRVAANGGDSTASRPARNFRAAKSRQGIERATPSIGVGPAAHRAA